MATKQVTVTKWIWEFTGQAAHCMAGYLAVSKAKQYGGRRTQSIVTVVGVAAAAIKEFWWDYKYEDAATRGSSLLDFSMYMIGISLGWLF